jgi:hypothetical protein
MQKAVEPRYRRDVGGWKISSVSAHRQANGGVFMAKAKGVTAKKLWKTKPDDYRSAMAAISQVEMDLLLGMTEEGNPRPFFAHANPDFHDGQVIIDVATRNVQILDFGQAVSITNAERAQAVEILRVVAGAESAESATKLVNRWARRAIVDAREMKKILGSSGERMDRFVKLISEMNLRGYEVPIAGVHWVMAANRQIALGEKIGVRNEAIFKHLALSQKLGLGQKAFNQAHLLIRKVRRGWTRLEERLGDGLEACRHLWRRSRAL